MLSSLLLLFLVPYLLLLVLFFRVRITRISLYSVLCPLPAVFLFLLCSPLPSMSSPPKYCPLAICLAHWIIVPYAACSGSVNSSVIALSAAALAPNILYVAPLRCCYTLFFCYYPLCRRSLILSSLMLFLLSFVLSPPGLLLFLFLPLSLLSMLDVR